MPLPLHAEVLRKAPWPGSEAEPRPNILLADDEPAKRLALAEALEGLEHHLDVASHGREVLKLLLKRQYAVVLLDVKMPDIDGFEIARLIRERAQSRHTPIIFITAHRADELDMRRGYSLGAVDYIFAPVSPAILRAKVSVFLELERMRHALELEIAAGRHAAAEIEGLNRDLQRRAAELEAANRELDRFAALVAHDLRAPLRAIEGYARMFEEDHLDRLDGEGRRLVRVVREESRRLDLLIEKLLDFTRFGREPMEAALIDMGELARAAFMELKDGGGARAPALLMSDLPTGRGDPALIRQVWTNLLSNAIKYSGRRSDPVIEVAGHTVAGENVYCVRDNGAGFDMRHYERLFGLFQRLPEAKQYDGAGVGLAIVERIVNRHGGRVWAESKPDQGASFYFTLPA